MSFRTLTNTSEISQDLGTAGQTKLVLGAVPNAKVTGLASIATTGAYGDLSGKPTVFTGDSGSGGSTGLVPAPVSGDAAAGKYLKADGVWTVPPAGGGGTPGGSSGQLQYNNAGAFAGMTAMNGDATLNTSTGAITVSKKGGIAFATVATSGAYADLSGKPTSMTPTVHATSHAFGNSDALTLTKNQISDWPSFATVATTGAYADLSGKPTSMTPTAHAASHATGGGDAISIFKAQISDFPSLAAVATTGTYASLTSIPSTFTPSTHASSHAAGGGDQIGITAVQITNSTTAGRAIITAADANAQTALLSSVVGDSGSGGTKGLVPAPSTGDAAAGKYLKADGTWAVPPTGGGGGGGWTQLATQTVSTPVATLDFTGLDLSPYMYFLIDFSGAQHDFATAASINLKLGFGGGPTYVSTSLALSSQGANTLYYTENVLIPVKNATSGGTILNNFRSCSATATAITIPSPYGRPTAARFLGSAGNLTAGTFTLYGL